VPLSSDKAYYNLARPISMTFLSCLVYTKAVHVIPIYKGSTKYHNHLTGTPSQALDNATWKKDKSTMSTKRMTISTTSSIVLLVISQLPEIGEHS